MNSVKLALLLASLILFAIACNTNTSNSNQTSNAGAQPSPAATSATSATNTNTSAKPAEDEFAHAAGIYQQECSFCHGEEAKGGIVKTKEGKRLKVPSLVEGHALNHTEEQLRKQIAEGGEGMPAFKDKLTPEEINQMVRFVRQKLQAGAAPASNSPMPNMSKH